jgi:hypothetical protein
VASAPPFERATGSPDQMSATLEDEVEDEVEEASRA